MPRGLRFPGLYQRRSPNERHRIAKIIVEDIGFFPAFKGRLKEPYPVVGYDRMLVALELCLYGPRRDPRERYARLAPTIDDFIHIVRERIAPEERDVGADGRWTPNDGWDEGGGVYD